MLGKAEIIINSVIESNHFKKWELIEICDINKISLSLSFR